MWETVKSKINRESIGLFLSHPLGCSSLSVSGVEMYRLFSSHNEVIAAKDQTITTIKAKDEAIAAINAATAAKDKTTETQRKIIEALLAKNGESGKGKSIAVDPKLVE